MNKKSLLIIDDNQKWCDALKKELDSCGLFHAVAPIYNGRDAIDYIVSNKPEVIILDMLIPEYDGLYIINYLRHNIGEYHPFVYVVSGIGADRTIQIMSNLNVDYYSIKPIQAKAVADNLRELVFGLEKEIDRGRIYTSSLEASKPKSIGLEKHIEDYLYDMGAPLYRLSTQCMRVMLRICLSDESKLGNLTATYKIGAQQMNPPISPFAFDRNIRSTIQNVLKASTNYFEQCFPDKSKKLTNSYFIDISIYRIKSRIEEFLGDQVSI